MLLLSRRMNEWVLVVVSLCLLEIVERVKILGPGAAVSAAAAAETNPRSCLGYHYCSSCRRRCSC